jgi:hypothetical protein
MLTNRENPPDAILREVFLRTGVEHFARINDVISGDELVALSERYRRVASFDKDTLRERQASKQAYKFSPPTRTTLDPVSSNPTCRVHHATIEDLPDLPGANLANRRMWTTGRSWHLVPGG